MMTENAQLPCRVKNFLPHKVSRELREDGTILLTSDYPIEGVVNNTGVWLQKWAVQTPDSIFLAERSGDGWREISYKETFDQVRAIASSLIAKGLDKDKPIAILSGNSINHALLSLAAQYIGIPLVTLAEQYSLIPGAHGRLIYIINKTNPSLVYVEDAGQYSSAINLDAIRNIEVVATNTDDASREVIAFSDLLKGAVVDLKAAHAEVGPDTLAKIMFTSGSTSDPKGVCTTQRMLCANHTQVGQIFPFLKDKPPKILDWLPWNHVFGGGHNFNTVLCNGGSLYIDDGKPTKKDFPKTLRNLKEHAGSISLNVPVGFAMMVEEFAKDTELRRKYYENLDMIVYAGASLPQPVWEGLENYAMQEVGAVPMMISSWGMTETAPAALYVHEPINKSGIIGVPVPGFTAKLIPDEENRCELRVKGPNVMKSYYRDEEKTAEAFDEEGYFITGDAVRFVDIDNPSAGLKFDGRVSEDFKLLTGTWVQASILRLLALEYLAPLANDIVICGQDRSEIGILVFPNPDYLKDNTIPAEEDKGALAGDALLSDLKQRMEKLSTIATGSSRRISRGIILSSPPSLEAHEMTGKGNLNARKVQERRADLVDRLYSDSDAVVVRI